MLGAQGYDGHNAPWRAGIFLLEPVECPSPMLLAPLTPSSQAPSISTGSIHCTTRPIRRQIPNLLPFFLDLLRRRNPRVNQRWPSPDLALVDSFLSLVKPRSPHNLPHPANTPRPGHEVDRSLPRRTAALAMAGTTRVGGQRMERRAGSPRPVSCVPQLMDTHRQQSLI
jgi:hypothetical protein